MKRSNKTYYNFQAISAICMILALLWLTVSIPFVNAAQQNLAKTEQKAQNTNAVADREEESANPFGNNTEEKAPNGSTNLSEEYLHDYHTHDAFFLVIMNCHNSENADTYIAFHGELLVPPPNAA